MSKMPGLLVARYVLWKIGMFCLVIGLAIVATVVTIVPALTGARSDMDWIGFIGAGLVWVSVPVWLAYMVVRMVGRYRLPDDELEDSAE